MKAALLIEPNKPLVLEEVKPWPLQHGQVLVQVLASGICGAQLQEINGTKGNFFPRLLGHEAAVRVLETGVGVKLKPGDKCVAHWRPGAGIESDFPRYFFRGEMITSGLITTFSEQSIISENRLTKVPEDAPDELCSLLGCALSTALGTIEQEVNLLMGESVLVIGCGGLGLNLIRAARMRRAGKITGVDQSYEKMDVAISAGADDFVHVHDWHEADSADVIIDTTGSPTSLGIALGYLNPSGRFIMVGQPPPDHIVQIPNARSLFNGSGCTIKATQGGGFRPHLDIPRYYNLWKSGQLDLSGIISHTISLDQINDGITLVKNGQAGRILIRP